MLFANPVVVISHCMVWWASCSPAKEGAVNEGCQVDNKKLVLDRDLPEVDGLEGRPHSQLRKVGGPEVLLNLPLDSLHHAADR